MGMTQLRLLVSRRFIGLFIAQFCGALNDNLFKNALVIAVAYRGVGTARDLEVLVTIATALFIAPYFIFSATAGQLADKFEKAHLIRALKIWEIGVMSLASIGFASGSLGFGLTVLFLLGVQAAFFGPVKYGILPELLAPEDLVSGNAVIEAGTFLAILIGTIAGGLLILASSGPAIVSAALLIFSVSGWAASLAIPRAGRAAPDLRINPNIFAETWSVLRYANDNRIVRWTILGNSWFWFVVVAMVSQFPNYAKDVLGANNQIVTFFLTINSIGVGAGSMLAGRVLHGNLTPKLVPIAAAIMAVFALDLWLVDGTRSGADFIDMAAFLTTFSHWRLSFDLTAIALGGGLFVVPLYAIMQARSPVSHRARIVAANNVWNALFMVSCGFGSALMLQFGASVTDIFLVVGVSNVIVAVGTWRLRR